MAVNVWTLNGVLNACIIKFPSLQWKFPQRPDTDTGLSVAQTANMAMTSNSTENGKNVRIEWTSATMDGLLGRMTLINEAGCSVYDEPCITNLQDRILDGVYTAVVDLSPRLQYLCPHIQVPLRDQAAGGDAGLRIHAGNLASQSLGCVFPGTCVDGDAVDNSREAFNNLMSLLPQDESEFTVTISTNL